MAATPNGFPFGALELVPYTPPAPDAKPKCATALELELAKLTRELEEFKTRVRSKFADERSYIASHLGLGLHARDNEPLNKFVNKMGFTAPRPRRS